MLREDVQRLGTEMDRDANRPVWLIESYRDMGAGARYQVHELRHGTSEHEHHSHNGPPCGACVGDVVDPAGPFLRYPRALGGGKKVLRVARNAYRPSALRSASIAPAQAPDKSTPGSVGNSG